MFKIGLGYDIHRLIKGRKLILGGIEIPHHKGLDGHSDADCVLHAISDSLLGALGKGDIGEHFPNTDPKYKGISSLKLLEIVFNLVKKNRYHIGNIDVMIQAEKPSLRKYKPLMRARIAKSLDIKQDCVNIKATTNEGLGAIGQGKGIACFAVALLEKKRT